MVLSIFLISLCHLGEDYHFLFYIFQMGEKNQPPTSYMKPLESWMIQLMVQKSQGQPPGMVLNCRKQPNQPTNHLVINYQPTNNQPTNQPTNNQQPTTNPTQPNPTQPNPTQPNPTQPNPTQFNPTQPNPTQPNPTQPKPTNQPTGDSKPSSQRSIQSWRHGGDLHGVKSRLSFFVAKIKEGHFWGVGFWVIPSTW